MAFPDCEKSAATSSGAKVTSVPLIFIVLSSSDRNTSSAYYDTTPPGMLSTLNYSEKNTYKNIVYKSPYFTLLLYYFIIELLPG